MYSYLVDATLPLTSIGTGLFLMDAGLFIHNEWLSDELADEGFSIRAILSLPGKPFAPDTSLPGVLVMVDREAPHAVFLAELAHDSTRNAAVARNLTSGKTGKSPQLGVMVPASPMQTVESVITSRSLAKRAAAFGYPVMQMREIGEMFVPQRGTGDDFDDYSNVVYIPLVGTSPAVSSRADLRKKAHDYAQVRLNPELALAGYVAEFLNSQAGQTIRRESMTGVTRLQLSRPSVERMDIYLPDLETQGQLVQLQSTIRDTELNLKQLHGTYGTIRGIIIKWPSNSSR